MSMTEAYVPPQSEIPKQLQLKLFKQWLQEVSQYKHLKGGIARELDLKAGNVILFRDENQAARYATVIEVEKENIVCEGGRILSIDTPIALLSETPFNLRSKKELLKVLRPDDAKHHLKWRSPFSFFRRK